MIMIPLTQGKVAIVDDIDADLVQYKWYARRGRKTFYAARGIWFEGKCIVERLHNVIGARLGIQGQVDHANNDGLDNRRSNLRSATQSQQQGNTLKRLNKSSKYKGVSRAVSINKWLVGIRINKRWEHIGYFDEEIDAARAYDKKALEYFGEYARTNHDIFGI